MTCKICGDENAILATGNRGILCMACEHDTPPKVSFAEFDEEYWHGCSDGVPLSMRREFYDDYRCSKKTLAEYIKATSSFVD